MGIQSGTGRKMTDKIIITTPILTFQPHLKYTIIVVKENGARVVYQNTVNGKTLKEIVDIIEGKQP